MEINRVLDLLQAFAAAAVIARIASLRLGSRFPYIMVWLAGSAAFSVAFSLQSSESGGYFWTYMASVPVLCVLDILAVRELTAVVFQDYPGITTVGRWAIYLGTAASASVSVLAAAIFRRSGPASSEHLFYAELLQRSVVFCLAVVILSVAWGLSRYPLNLGRNVIVSAVAFVALFLGAALQLLIDSFQTWLFNRSLDLLASGFTTVCLFAWTALLRREVPALPRPSVPLQADTALDELAHLNRLLARAARNL